MMAHRDLLASHEVTMTNASMKGELERSKLRHKGATANEDGGGEWTARKIVLDLSTAPQLTKEERVLMRSRDYVKKGSLLRLGQVDLRPRSLFKTTEEFAMVEAKRLGRPYEEVLKEFLEEEEEDRQLEAQTRDLSALAGKKVVTKEDSTTALKADDTAAVSGAKEAGRSGEGKQEQPGRAVVYREFIEKETSGIIVAWSAMTRSGMCIKGPLGPGETLSAELVSTKPIFVIRNVASFNSAMPNAMNLRGREVTFSVVSYTEGGVRHPNLFAEDIVVTGELDIFQPDRRIADENKSAAKAKKVAEDVASRTQHEDRTGAQFGVITRWSGGQGAVEASTGETFYIERGSDFDEAVDVKTNAAALRGAVVTFFVDSTRPQFATSLRLLSTPQPSNREVKTVPYHSPRTAHEVPPASLTPQPVPLVPRVERAPPSSDPRWMSGVLSSWSAVEGSGIIQLLAKEDTIPPTSTDTSSSSTMAGGSDRLEGLDIAALGGASSSTPPAPTPAKYSSSSTPVGTWIPDSRFVLREAAETLVNFEEHKALLKKGRRVQFIPGGSTGKIAQFVVVDMSEVSEEELKMIEDKERGSVSDPSSKISGSAAADGADFDPQAAAAGDVLPPPTSGAYWFARAEKAGFDMSELKAMKGREGEAVDPYREDPRQRMEGNQGIDLNDPIEVLENDPWFKDPQKNKKFPNSDMRYGDMQRTSPIAMMSLANKVRDPKKLEETKDKYYNKLTEPMKEWCWQQAKEQAPKFEQRIKEAKLKGQEPTFHYF
jgi:hypothetical protein